MKDEKIVIRVMTMEDFEQVHKLWMGIHGFGIRSIDDSKEGVERFLKRNPTPAWWQLQGRQLWVQFSVGMTEGADVCTLCV